MAEQFALQQFGGNRGGVERHERAGRARRFVVQRVRHQLLAGAGFAIDQHRQRRLRQPPDRTEQRAHRRGIAHQLWALVRCGGRGGLAGRGERRIGRRQHALRQCHRVVQVERLGQELLRPATERPGGAGDIGVGRHHDDRQLRMGGLELVEQYQAVITGHAHVGEQQVRNGLRVQCRKRRRRPVETIDLVAGIAQCGTQHEAHRAVIVDHPDALAGGRYWISHAWPPLRQACRRRSAAAR